MDKLQKREEMLNGNLAKVFAKLAIPIVANTFIQTMYNLTDTYWLGKMGEEHQAAITIVSPVQNIIVNFGSGIVVAGSILISQYLGARKEDDAKKMASHIFTCSMIFSVICSLLCFLATPAIVNWLGAENVVKNYSTTYLRIVMLDMPFLFMINIFQAVNQSQGNTVRPMLLNTLGVIFNMILDPLFMFTFGWGIAGAALATLLAKVPCAIIAFISLSNKNNPIYITLKKFKFDKNMVLSIIKLGIPTALGSSTMQFGFLLMGKSVVKYGTVATAAYGIGNKVNGLVTLPSNAMGSATATIVGINFGARQYDRADKAYRLSRNVSVIFLFIGGMILSRNAVSTAIVGVFSNSDEVVVKAAEFLAILSFYCWTNGIYNSTMGLFQGSGHTMITMAVDATRLWVFRFATLFICESILHMGLQSIWYSVVISNGLSAFILYILYRTKVWRKEVVKLRR
ncbi:MATE family efflux transporter [Clostridium sp. Marseille-P299]|uniref:MATE family efflux transporter n=1 Tax=Clostridium sp. Marseille-P299 TaxID=1805477 RepID=UPI00082D2E59|nr:MATE family efflux transporter [Clostridium sp. Marseille-P299]